MCPCHTCPTSCGLHAQGGEPWIANQPLNTDRGVVGGPGLVGGTGLVGGAGMVGGVVMEWWWGCGGVVVGVLWWGNMVVRFKNE